MLFALRISRKKISTPKNLTNKNQTMARKSSSFLFLFLFFFLLTAFETGKIHRFAEANKRRIHITDDLDDVVDDEEDEAWKEWGMKRSTSPAESGPPPDFSEMSLQEIQTHMMNTQSGPVFGFAKLRPGVRRTPEMVSEIAKKWTKIARTGAIEAKFMGMDLNTIMVTMERGQDAGELQEFLLSQEEAYEIKLGDQIFRREGDPPLEEVVEKLRSEKSKADQSSSGEEEKHQEL